MPDGYPRDMVGYGRDWPDPKWPGGARIAVQFVINFEEGAELNVLHGDAASESLLSEFGFALPRPGDRYLPGESMYEYGTRVGFWRLHKLFTERSIPITVNAVAMALERQPEAVATMVEADWELSSHGYRWIDYHGVPEEVEREHIQKAVDIHVRMTGQRPLGCFIGRRSQNTVRLVAEDGGFIYTQDSYADEVPYWIVEAGRPLLVVPYAADVNDHRFATSPGFDERLELSRAQWNQLFIPVGFAHGFVTLVPETEVAYKVSDYYSPEHDRAIRFDDPTIAIRWPAGRGLSVRLEP